MAKKTPPGIIRTTTDMRPTPMPRMFRGPTMSNKNMSDIRPRDMLPRRGPTMSNKNMSDMQPRNMMRRRGPTMSNKNA